MIAKVFRRVVSTVMGPFVSGTSSMYRQLGVIWATVLIVFGGSAGFLIGHVVTKHYPGLEGGLLAASVSLFWGIALAAAVHTVREYVLRLQHEREGFGREKQR